MLRTRLGRRVRQTSASILLLFTRVAGGLPLLFYGGLHLIDPLGFRSLLHAAGIAPEADLMVVVPLVEMVAGILLLAGSWARVGALLAVLAMIPAIHASLVLAEGSGNPRVDTDILPQAPPLWMPLLVMLCVLIVLARGAGAFSADYRSTLRAEEPGVDQRMMEPN
jgi:uncharacterized membrane protein YphA (DoxX/SURF4 family)